MVFMREVLVTSEETAPVDGGKDTMMSHSFFKKVHCLKTKICLPLVRRSTGKAKILFGEVEAASVAMHYA